MPDDAFCEADALRHEESDEDRDGSDRDWDGEADGYGERHMS